MPYKHWVGGSNPSATTRYSTGHGFSVARFFFRRRIVRVLTARRACLFSADVVPGSCRVSARFFDFAPRFCREMARIQGLAARFLRAFSEKLTNPCG